MLWADALVEGLKRAELRHVPYVADAPLDHVIRRLSADPFFRPMPLSREDEGVGVLIGAHLAGEGGALLMQSSGFGQCVNALASLAIPYQVPLLMVISRRGDLGEFNVCQVPLGQALPRILESLGIPCVTLDRAEEVAGGVQGAWRLSRGGKTPVAVVLSTALIGAKA